MAKHRISQINEEMVRALSSIMSTVKDARISRCVFTVTAVETAPDLSFAKVYYSYIGNSTPKEIKEGLRSATGYIRSSLAKKLNLRQTPALAFSYDDSLANGAHISSLLHSIEDELAASKARAEAEAAEVAEAAENEEGDEEYED